MSSTPAKKLTYISMFSGIEAASVAWETLGFEPLAFAEVDPFPSAVLKKHYPHVPNLGDITSVDWSEYHGKVDIVVGGSPCQSFSVAGLRKGLDDPRGNLMLEYLRACDQIRPEWIVWENVPGVLSADGGRAFGAFLGSLEELGYHAAWRVLDAQFFGVAQRRRRIFVVAHARDWRRAAAVLFERESLFGDFASSREARAGFAAAAEARARATGGAMTFHPGSSYESGDIGCQEEVAPPLRAGGGGNSIPGVWQPSEKTIAFSYGNSSDSRSMGEAEEVTPTIRAGGGGNSVPVVCHQEGRTSDLYSISGNIIGREAKNGGNHTGVASGEEPMYTLTTADLHAVCWTTPEGESSCLNPWETQSGRVFSQDGVFPTLTGGAKGERGYAGGCVLGSIPENAIGRPNSGTNGPMTYGADEPSPTLTASSNVPAIAFNHNASASQGFAVSDELSPTLRTCNGNNSNMPAVLEPEAIDPTIVLNDQGGSRMNVSYDTAPTLRANSKGNEPIVMGSGQGKAGISEGLCPTQTARQYKDPPILFEKRKTNTLAFDTTQVTSAQNRSNPQWNGPCHTLSACGEAPSVFLSSDAGETGEARDEKDSRGFAQNTRNELRYIGGDGSLAGALAAQPGMKQQTFLESSFGVRRLTPVECERLQGFPDNWTRIEWNGKPEEQCPNSRRYKAIGNSMAVPVMAWIGKGLLAVQENMEDS